MTALHNCNVAHVVYGDHLSAAEYKLSVLLLLFFNFFPPKIKFKKINNEFITCCQITIHSESSRGGIYAALLSKEEVTLTVTGGRQKVKNTHTHKQQYDVKVSVSFAAKNPGWNRPKKGPKEQPRRGKKIVSCLLYFLLPFMCH